jgi:phosphoribosylformylglycinamidine synthase
MRVAVLQFPGSNCDADALQAVADCGGSASLVWHGEASLAGFDAVWVPGGFSYGDYLRCGAMAARSPIIGALREAASAGLPVIGVCNGFQILCEAGILPGALLANEGGRFVCQDVWLRSEGGSPVWPMGVGEVVSVPIAHGEGRFTCDAETLAELEGEGRVAFRYSGPDGSLGRQWNPNGSVNGIAGIFNAAGNVLGLMPHPERATRTLLGGTDGLKVLSALTLVRAN